MPGSDLPSDILAIIGALCMVTGGMLIVAFLLLRDAARLRSGVAERDARVRWLETTLADAGSQHSFRRHDAGASPELEARMEAKSRFLATVSHEIRTPLNGVLGMAGLLADTSLDAEQRTYVSAIKTSGEALLSLIDEILDFSKIEAGKMGVSLEPCDVRALVEGVAELLAPRAQGKDIEIAISIPASVPPVVITDPARLRQVLINLAGNAVKFTESGGVGLRVDARDGRLRFTVSDSGIGIAPDRLGVIFKEFEQVDGSAASRFGGTGLGLAISSRIVANLGGAISVESEPGVGSRFLFDLPLDLPAALEGEAPAASPAPDLSGEKILIVASSRFEAPSLVERITEAGGTAMQVTDAAAARRLISDDRSLTGVIVDCALGSADVRALSASATAAGVARRLIMLSPFERRSFGSPAAAGFDGYLVKPVRPRSLYARLGGADDIESAEADERPRAPPAPPPGLRVLLAEDNEINALLAMRLLERSGCEAVWARDGAAALLEVAETAQRRARPFDAILMDIRMPGIDGLEAARRVRALELDAGLARTRIVALTANAFEDDRRACFEAGIDAFVPKPLDQARLFSALAPAPGEAGRRAA